jgi:hypothetical protein
MLHPWSSEIKPLVPRRSFLGLSWVKEFRSDRKPMLTAWPDIAAQGLNWTSGQFKSLLFDDMEMVIGKPIRKWGA